MLAATVLAVLAVPGAARAGTGLAGSDPRDGAVLVTTPAAVRLTFTGEPDLDDSHVAVLDDRGTAVTTADPRPAEPRTLRLPLDAGLTGDLTVAWHVSFRDGGQSQGTVRFSVGTGRPPAPAGAQLDRAAADLLDSHAHGIDPLSAVLLVVNGVVVLGAVTLLLVHNPRRPRAWRLPAEFGGGGPPPAGPRAEPDAGSARIPPTTGRGTT
ncbi:copper resistance protein CopC [Micromonospora sp. PLK6-60]|uniref:copper resistance CopC family protein n=1 Tax=Micromonospora sp. PLK6-60 TaxID=2873383 RepID=UPI001CA6C1BA|nr:copper resistance CopC family protein [Micromonospora sp. PLK6-60]MBY8870804.1 copper resistance protein CopC [Micromonospora sp. PLK6-60]